MRYQIIYFENLPILFNLNCKSVLLMQNPKFQPMQNMMLTVRVKLMQTKLTKTNITMQTT